MNCQVIEPLPEFIAHTETQCDHTGRLIQDFLEIQGIESDVLGWRHVFLKLHELKLLCLRLMGLQDVVSYRIFDLFR